MRKSALTLLVCLTTSSLTYCQKDTSSNILVPRYIIENVVAELSDYDACVQERDALEETYEYCKQYSEKMDSLASVQKKMIISLHETIDIVENDLLIERKKSEGLEKKLKRRRTWGLIMVGVLTSLIIIK